MGQVTESAGADRVQTVATDVRTESVGKPQLPIRSVIREEIMGSAGKLLGIAISLAVVGVIETMSIIGGSASAGLGSAVNIIAEFLGLIGLGLAVGMFLDAFESKRGGRR